MRYTVTAKLCSLSQEVEGYIMQESIRLTDYLSGVDSEIPHLDIIIRKNKKKGLNNIEGKKVVDNPIFYDGTLKLMLPKKPLVVNILGKTIDEALKTGFKTLKKTLETYKGEHMKSYSKFKDHATLRK